MKIINSSINIEGIIIPVEVFKEPKNHQKTTASSAMFLTTPSSGINQGENLI